AWSCAKTEKSMSPCSRVVRPSQASTAQPPHSAHGAPNAAISSATRTTGSGAPPSFEDNRDKRDRSLLWFAAAQRTPHQRDAYRQSGKERTRCRAEELVLRPLRLRGASPLAWSASLPPRCRVPSPRSYHVPSSQAAPSQARSGSLTG